jgi:hypothetical protein
MPLFWFQVGCVAVLAIAYGATVFRAPSPVRRACEIGILALAGWIGEETCIRAYRFYGYAEGWWLQLGYVPLLVPLIWPMVVLSARDVARVLAPRAARLSLAALAALIVCFDASLMEVVSVGAGYWRWAEPGYLEVPLIGVLGWGCFAFGALWTLDRIKDRPLSWLLLVVPAGLFTTHVLLVALWWGGFRWGLRGDLGVHAIGGFAVIAGLATCVAWRVRATGARLPGVVAFSRSVATVLFAALLLALVVRERRFDLLAHAMLSAVPYLLLTGLPGGSPDDVGGAPEP